MQRLVFFSPLPIVYSLFRRMSVVNVRCVEEDEVMTISFAYEGKQRKMQRTKTELLAKVLTRIGLSSSGKKKAKKAKNEADLQDAKPKKATLWYDGVSVDENLPNKDAWKDGSVLKIDQQSYRVELNPPTILSLQLPTSFMSGFPIFPTIELDFAEKQYCSYKWSKSISQDVTEASKFGEIEWEMVGTHFCYTPTVHEVGCYLRLECTPASAQRSSAVKSEATSSVTVAAGPGESPFDARHLYTAKRIDDPKSFRVVSYNTLANTYTKEEFALNVLYPYCPPYALNIQYRQQLLLKELIGYNADVICLQECGNKLFTNILSPALEVLGFQGLMCSKSGEVPEGEALFFHKDKFQLYSQHNIVLQEALFKESVQGDILDKVSALPALCEVLRHRNTIAQVTVLRPVAAENDKLLCVVNTHLYFKPRAPHVRLIQVGIILNHVKQVLAEICERKAQSFMPEHKVNDPSPIRERNLQSTTQIGHATPGINKDVTSTTHSASSTSTKPEDSQSEHSQITSSSKVAVIFCGDFNSFPNSGVCELLSTGQVSQDHEDWLFPEDKEQHCTTLSLCHNLKLFSACGVPEFTNFTGGFKGTLDYIFADSSQLNVEAAVPLPSEEELQVYVALPSVVLPSDHLALVCELKWKSSDHGNVDMQT